MKFALLVFLVAALALAEARPQRKIGRHNVRKLANIPWSKPDNSRSGVVDDVNDCVLPGAVVPTGYYPLDKNGVIVDASLVDQIVRYCHISDIDGVVQVQDIEVQRLFDSQFVIVDTERVDENGKPIYELKYQAPVPVAPLSGESDVVKYDMGVDGIIYPDGGLPAGVAHLRYYYLVNGTYYPEGSEPVVLTDGEVLIDDASSLFIVVNGTYGPELILRPAKPATGSITTTDGEVQAPQSRYEVRRMSDGTYVLFRNGDSGIDGVTMDNTEPTSAVVTTDGEQPVGPSWLDHFHVERTADGWILVLNPVTPALRQTKTRTLTGKRQRTNKLRRVF